MQYLHEWIEFQERYGKRIQRRMEQLLAAKGKSDTYTVEDLTAVGEQAEREIVGQA